MRNTLFTVSILSMVLLSCGKSEQAAETTTPNTVEEVVETQVVTVSEAQDTATVMPAAEEIASSEAGQAAGTGMPEQAAAVSDASESVTEGEAIYKRACISCHMTGAAGAPKLGDASAWQPRIAKGVDALVQSAIAGVPGTAMVAKGACNNCSDDDISAAVEYMAAQSR